MGKLYLVGAGPGDPRLITLRAYEVLREADAVLYDRLVNPEILSYVKPSATVVYVGKEVGEQGGDPFIFGRGAEELIYFVKRGVEVEVVPGISSCIGVPELVGIPLTLRGCSSSFTVVAGNDEDTDWSVYRRVGTLVILMGIRNRRRIASELIKAGRDPLLHPCGGGTGRCGRQPSRPLCGGQGG